MEKKGVAKHSEKSDETPTGDTPEGKVLNAMKTKATRKKTTRTPAVERKAKKQAARPALERITQTVKQPGKPSKKQTIIDLLRKEGGASLAELRAATGWQAHSVRGFISGALRKNLGLVVSTAKNDAGETAYRITS